MEMTLHMESGEFCSLIALAIIYFAVKLWQHMKGGDSR